jgi:hypothetical protein
MPPVHLGISMFFCYFLVFYSPALALNWLHYVQTLFNRFLFIYTLEAEVPNPALKLGHIKQHVMERHLRSMHRFAQKLSRSYVEVTRCYRISIMLFDQY